MNESLIERHNDVVRSEHDTVYHLGDFGFHAPTQGDTEDLGVLWWRLRGKKHLVIGNHDLTNPQVLRLPWESQEVIKVLKADGARLVLCHYPIESWPAMHHGAIHLHGHSHNSLSHRIAKRYDVGVEAYPNGPVSLDEIIERAGREYFTAVDHHRGKKNA